MLRTTLHDSGQTGIFRCTCDDIIVTAARAAPVITSDSDSLTKTFDLLLANLAVCRLLLLLMIHDTTRLLYRLEGRGRTYEGPFTRVCTKVLHHASDAYRHSHHVSPGPWTKLQ
jgi:hypothetical protein